MDRLTELLSPLAERNGHRKGAGEALLEELMRIAGIDEESIAKQIASIPSLAGLVTPRYLESSREHEKSDHNALASASGDSSATSWIEEQLRAGDLVSIAGALQLK